MDIVQVRESPYFKTLPKMIQESIMMSGVKFETEDDIRKFVSNLEARN